MSLPQNSFSLTLVQDKFIFFGGDGETGSYEIKLNLKGEVEEIEKKDK